MNHAMLKLSMTGRRILFIVGLLFCSTAMQGTYTVGGLDTTADGGTGFGNATPSSAPGYISTGYSGNPFVINASAIQADGKTVVAGSIADPAQLVLLRYNIDGTNDLSFSSDGAQQENIPFVGGQGVLGAITGIAIAPNGKIIVVGTCTISLVPSFFILRLNAGNGGIDTTFGNSGFLKTNIGSIINGTYAPTSSVDGSVSVALDLSGRILVSGTTTITQSGHTTQDIFVARFTANGAGGSGASLGLDTTFNSSSAVGGVNFSGVQTVPGIGLISSTISGPTLIPLASNAMALDANQNIVVVGSVSLPYPILFVARFTSSGVLDTTGSTPFTVNGYAAPTSLAGGQTIGYGVSFQSTGKIVVCGTTNGAAEAFVARFTTSGLLDTTFGSGSGYITSSLGGTSSIAYGIEVQENDTIVVGGQAVVSTVTEFAIGRFLADGSNIDTTFNSPLGYTTTTITAPNLGRTLCMQQNGSFLIGGSVGLNAGTARYLGDIPQGCMDYSYPATTTGSDVPGFVAYPTDSTEGDNPKVIAMYPSAGGNLYALTSAGLGGSNIQVIQLASDGSISSNLYTIPEPIGADVIADFQNRAVAVGTTASSTGWIGRYVNSIGAMTTDSSFNGGSIYEEVHAASFARVAGQNSGQLIAMGQSHSTSTQGILVAYTSLGALATTTFGSGLGYIVSATSTSTFCDILIDSSNKIYVAWQDTSGSGHIKIDRYVANGSGLDGSFAESGIFYTGWSVATYGAPVLSFDNYGNIVVAAANVSTGQIDFQQFAPSVSGSSTTIATGSIADSTSLFATPVTLTKLQCDIDDRLIINGYDNYNSFVGRLNQGSGTTPYALPFTLDTTFAPYSSSPGILKTVYNANYNPFVSFRPPTDPVSISNSVCINTNGAILFCGYEKKTSLSTVSLIGQVVGNTGGTVYTQVPRYPTVSPIGTVGGTVDLATSASLADGHPRAIYTFGAGAFNGYTLVANQTSATDTTLSMVDNTYALNTSTGATSFGSGTGSIALTGLAAATCIMIDTVGDIYVLGTTSTNAVIAYVVNSAGTTASVLNIPTASMTAGLTSAYGIVEQASGRILICGYNSDRASGAILAYDPVHNQVDSSFNPGNTSGYWYTGIANPITAISVGTLASCADRLYCAYNNGPGDAIVVRLLENGTALDSTFTFVTPTPLICSDATQIRMQLDVNGKIVFVVQTGGTAGIQAARYNADGTNDVAPFTVIPNSYGTTLKEILCLSNGSTLIFGANGTTLDLSRLTPLFVADPTFDAAGTTTGLLSTTVADQTEFFAVDVIGNGADGIIISSDTNAAVGSAVPYLTQVISDVAVTKVSQSASALGAAGILDTTFNAAGTNAGFMNLTSELQTTDFLAGTPAQVLLQLPNGTNYYVAGSTGLNTYVTQMSDDDVQVPGWAGSGLLTIGAGNLGGMLYGQNGGLYVAGGVGSHAGWVLEYDAADGSLNTEFNAPTGDGSVALDAYFAIAQQSNGRILVAGLRGFIGAIIAFNSVTGAVDTTFGVNGIYTLSSGNGAIYSMIVGANDTIYFTTTNGSTLSVKQLSANGTGALISGRSSLSSIDPTSTRVAFDQNNNIVAVSVSSSTQVTFARFNGANISLPDGAFVAAPLTITGVTTPHVTSMLVDLNASPGKVIITGYDSSPTPNVPFIARIVSGLNGLDTTFNNPTGVVTTKTVSGGVTTQWYAGMINADGKITVAGYASALTDAYLMRVYGDEFMGQYAPSVTAGVPGTINTNFGFIPLTGAGPTSIPTFVLPLANGYQYVGWVDGTLARYTNANILDTTFGIGGIAQSQCPGEIVGMIIDGNGQLVVIGDGSGYGFIVRYTNDNSGTFDSTFNGGSPWFLAEAQTSAMSVVQQSSSRYVVSGILTIEGNGSVLFGIPINGGIDSTFAINSPLTAGFLIVNSPGTPITLVADQYDRLLCAYQNGSNISISRFTSSGEVDTTFGDVSGSAYSGTIANALSDVVSPYESVLSNVYITLDESGNIVIAAQSAATEFTSGISYASWSNSIGATSVYAQTNIDTSVINSAILLGLIAVSDDNVLLFGSQLDATMWIARVTSSGNLDTSFGDYVTGSSGPQTGIMTFYSGIPSRSYLSSIAIYGTGEISIVFGEDNGTIYSFMSRAYNNPYTTQVPSCLDGMPEGTVDRTLGVTTNVGTGITFFATSGDVDRSCNQVGRAVVMQNGNDDGVVVALDGLAQESSSGHSIFINMFDVDGLLNTNFNPDAVEDIAPGQAVVLSDSSNFNNQYVNDMLTFTVGGVSKAILAGYATNITPSAIGSLLIQYILTADSPGLDASFGGFNGNYAGVAFGDGLKLQTVGLQSNSRIIGAGLDQSGNGLLLGYTASGNLDQSFGQGGTFVQGTSGIYTSVIDSQDRVVIAYTVGSTVTLARILADGSGLDTSFNYPNGYLTTTMTTAISNSNLRLAIDGNNNIAVAAVLAGGTTFSIASYLPSGSLNGTVNTISGMGLTAFTITRMLIDTNNNVVIVGYDHKTSSPFDEIVVGRLAYNTTLYVLDTTFNVPTGYVKYQVPAGHGVQKALGAFIHPDGRIIIAGTQENTPI